MGRKDQEESENKSRSRIILIIDRRDRVIILCEIKFSLNEFEIDKDDEMKLRNKASVFRQLTKSLVMIND